jgi:hypothetical protein
MRSFRKWKKEKWKCRFTRRRNCLLLNNRFGLIHGLGMVQLVFGFNFLEETWSIHLKVGASEPEIWKQTTYKTQITFCMTRTQTKASKKRERNQRFAKISRNRR